LKKDIDMLHSVISQKMKLSVTTAVKTSNPARAINMLHKNVILFSV
jgi:hypothetical protein